MMWYKMMLMSGTWYAKAIHASDVVEEGLDDGAVEMIEQGTIVAFCDNLETFASEMKIDAGDIQLVAPEDD